MNSGNAKKAILECDKLSDMVKTLDGEPEIKSLKQLSRLVDLDDSLCGMVYKIFKDEIKKGAKK